MLRGVKNVRRWEQNSCVTRLSRFLFLAWVDQKTRSLKSLFASPLYFIEAQVLSESKARPSEDHIPTIILLSALTILRICNFLLSLNISRMQLERLLSYILHIANCLLFAASLEAVLQHSQDRCEIYSKALTSVT